MLTAEDFFWNADNKYRVWCGVFLFVLLFSSLPVISTHYFKKEKKEKNPRLFWNILLIVLSLLGLLLYIYCKLIVNCLRKATSESNYSNWFNGNNCFLALYSERMKSPSAEFCSWLVWIFKFDKKCTFVGDQ